MKIINPILTPVTAYLSPSGQWRIRSSDGRVCSVARSSYAEQSAGQIVRTLNTHAELVRALRDIVTAFEENLTAETAAEIMVEHARNALGLYVP